MIGLFTGLSWAWRLAIVGGVLLALAGGYAAWHHDVFNQGWNAHKAATDKADKEKVDAADDGADRVHECVASGGVWRTGKGKCERR